MHTQLLTDDATIPGETSQALRISVSLVDVTDLEQAGRLWTELQERSQHSFFTSWGWIGCWLSQLPAAIRPQLLIAERQSDVVGLGFIARKRIRRGKLIPSKALFLHETGEPLYDSLTIEHNGFLAERGLEEPVHRAILNFLCDECPAWDELFLPCVGVESPLAKVAQKQRPFVRFRVARQRPCYMVDLVKINGSGKDYCSSLGSRTRANVRKSFRLYEERGPLTTIAPGNVDEALCFFEELKALHRVSWEARGESGAFSHAWLDGFHRRLIESRFPFGEIQLLQFKAGDQTIGFLYNFALDGHVAVYQTGFKYDQTAKVQPGLVCHALAIEMNRELGAHTYDFLAGDSLYKRCLGQAMQPVQWGVLQRNRLKFRLEDWLRSARQLIRFKGPLLNIN
jgi:CelD/BcsL family acetyltransferase involved in cellulose biosynthesis